MTWGKNSPAAEGFSLPLVLSLWLGALILCRTWDHKVYHPDAVAEFIVVPGNELDKVVTGSNASPSIKVGRVAVPVKVAGDNWVSVAQGALEGAL